MLVAQVQHALANPPLPEAGARGSWRDQRADMSRQLGSAPPIVRAELDDLAAELGSWSTDDGYGLVHLDIELDNIRWVGSEPGLLDFDDCAVHWHAVDVASALRDLDGDAERQASFLSGYDVGGWRAGGRAPGCGATLARPRDVREDCPLPRSSRR